MSTDTMSKDTISKDTINKDRPSGDNPDIDNMGSVAIDRSEEVDMRRTSAWRSPTAMVLAGLLAVQLALAGGFYWQGRQAADFAARGPLLNLDAASVDTVRVMSGDGEAETVSLARAEAGWRVLGNAEGEESIDVPADTAKVENLLESLGKLEADLPVATRSASRAQLDVAEDDYQRRLQLESGGEVVADLYIGSSPGFRKAHVRLADEDAIRAGEINVFDLPATLDDWLARDVLALAVLSRIEAEEFTLERQDDAWSLVTPSDGDQVSADDGDGVGDGDGDDNGEGGGQSSAGEDERALAEGQAAALADALSTLTVTGLAPPAASADVSDAEAMGEVASEATDEATDEATGDAAVEPTGSASGEVTDEAAGEVTVDAADEAAESPTAGANDSGVASEAPVTLAFTLETASGPRELTLTREGDRVTARRDDFDAEFTVSAGDFEALQSFDLDALLEPFDAGS